jgi:hypothetical protein
MIVDANFALAAILIGCGATLFMDLWAMLQKRALGVPSLDYALVGRWLGHLGRGKVFHRSIVAAPAITGEAALGWAAHYASGVAFAALLLAIYGEAWALSPTPGPALFVGIATIVAPFFILQPGMGAGIAASKTPRPNLARLRSVVAHVSFGLGLYIAASIMALLRA